ncbi:hypothetical protein DVR12_27190 [Chitinophaga silvatica]|uniref:4-alpha-L-fucosyltransferase glycosyl transferase group 56 n=1 Tax=Chitinophaga silvatica TaxID=2282649 RepID=A0A3E1Y233_9BACT|nr:TDP-N-acetylfucosamine:lipid II N-acetylfucosaminyltransferase [Chitinophaga silvatica]RFS18732.1 hypothetical protein DVR12_27190 [Chitinophaga silvatica]
MNYHLMVDDKFINDFITDAEKAAPGNNTYIIDTTKDKCRFVQSDLPLFVPFYTSRFAAILKSITAKDKVFIHWASDQAIKAVLALPPDVVVSMFFWGGDIVEIPVSRFKTTTFGPLSLQYFQKNEERPKVKWNPKRPKRLLTTFAQRYLNYNGVEKEIIRTRELFFKRLNFFFNWSYIDYQWVLRHYTTSAAYKYFYYNFNPKPSAEEQQFLNAPKNNQVTTILVGNSDTSSNNHLEALQALSVYKDQHIKLVIPLSYGNKEYGDLIEKEAISIFGKDKVTTIRGFMERSKYYELLSTVDVAVMYHFRTQAAGNTLALLYRGKKVFIHSNSTTYEFLKTNDITIYDSATIEHMDFATFAKPLNPEIIQSNITIMDTLFDPDKKMAALKEALI